MKAVAAHRDGTIEVVQVPIPSFGKYECLVRVRACGICNSTDMKIIKNQLGDFLVQYPALLGHESVGEVVEVGAKVRYLKVGDRVVNPRGRLEPGTPYHSTWLGMSEYGIAHDVRAILEDGLPLPPGVEIAVPKDYPTAIIPDNLSFEDAVILLTIKENYSAMLNFGVEKGSDVFIMGDGPVGMGLALVARYLGAKTIGCAGHHDERLAAIREKAGLELTVNTHRQTIAEAVKAHLFDVVVDAVGSNTLVLEGAQLLKQGGRVGVYGVLNRGNAGLNLLDLPNNTCVHMLNNPYGEYRAHDAVCEMVAGGHIELKDYYSHVLPIDQAAKGFEMIQSRESFKVILTMYD